MSDRAEKIGIVGAGSVGATIAYACMVRGIGKHISLFDRIRTKVEAKVLDLNHGLMFVPMAKLDGSVTPADCWGSGWPFAGARSLHYARR